MEPKIKSENTAEDNLDYNQDNLEKDPLNTDEDPLNIKIEEEELYNSGQENDILDTSEGTLENSCFNLDYLNVELKTFNSNVTLNNNFDVDTEEGDRYEEIFPPDSFSDLNPKDTHIKLEEDASFADSNISQPTENYKQNNKSKSSKRVFRKLYRCKLCKFCTKIKFNFIDHESFHSGKRPYTCPKCDSTFKYRSNLFSHNKKCSSIKIESFKLENKSKKPKNICSKRYECSDCNFKTKWEYSYIRHRNTKVCFDNKPEENEERKMETNVSVNFLDEFEKNVEVSAGNNTSSGHNKPEENEEGIMETNGNVDFSDEFEKNVEVSAGNKTSSGHNKPEEKEEGIMETNGNVNFSDEFEKNVEVSAGNKTSSGHNKPEENEEEIMETNGNVNFSDEFGKNVEVIASNKTSLGHGRILRSKGTKQKSLPVAIDDHLKSSEPSQNDNFTESIYNLSFNESDNEEKEACMTTSINNEEEDSIHCGDSFSDLELETHEVTSERKGSREFDIKSSLFENKKKKNSEHEENESILDSNISQPTKNYKANNKSKSNKSVCSKLYQCKLCKFSTKWRNIFLDHENFHTGERPYTCLNCNSSFKYRTNLSGHKRCCSGRDKFGKNAKVSTSNKTSSGHERILRSKETEQKSFHRGDSFSDLKLTITHEVTSKCEGSRELEIKSSLSEIQKEFHNKHEENVSTPDSHISQHTENQKQNIKAKSSKKVFKKLYQCKLCKFSTRHQFSFMEHESFHSGIRPYTCLKCDFSFRHQSSLCRHKKICSGRKIRGIKLENKDRNKCPSKISSDKTEFHEFGTNLSHDNIFRHHQNLRKISSQQKQNIEVMNKKRKLSSRFNRRRNLNLKLKRNAEILKFNSGSDKNSYSQKLNYDKIEEFEKDEIKETLQKFHSDEDKSNSSNESNTSLSSFRKNSEEIKGESGSSYKINDLNNKKSLIGTGSKRYKCSNCNFRTKWKLSYIRHKNTKVCFDSNIPEENEDRIKESTGSIVNFSDEFGKSVKINASNKTSTGHGSLLRSENTKHKSLPVAMDDHLKSNKSSENDNYAESICTSQITHKCIHCGDSFSDLKFLRTHEVTSKCEGSRDLERKSSLFENQKEPHIKHKEDVSLPDSNISQLTENYKPNNKSKSSKKLYQCKLCKFCTKNKCYFIDHESFHTGKRPYTCVKCNCTFKYRSNLCNHNKKCSSINEFVKNVEDSAGNKISSGQHGRILRSKETKQKSLQGAMDSNFISSKPSQNDNYTGSNEENTGGEIYSNISDINMDVNQSNEVDIDVELFKFFPSNSENSYGDEAIIQIFFQKPKVLLEKLKLNFCATCDFVSDSSSKLEAHKYETHLKSKMYECSECNYTSVTWRDLKKHEVTHQKNMCEESISSPSFIIENEEISLSNNKTDTNGLPEGKPQPGQSICNIFNERDNEEKEEEEDTCVILSTDNEEEEDTCMTLSTDNEEEDSSIIPSTYENLRINVNEDDDDVHSSVIPSTLRKMQTNTNKVKNILVQNIEDADSNSNYQVTRENDESDKKVENIDLNKFREIIGEVFNDKIRSLLDNILGSEIKKNPELSANTLESEQKFKDKILEIKPSQSGHDVDKSVNKTSYEYLRKAIEFYKDSVSDSEEDNMDSNDVDMITENITLQDLDPSFKNTGNTSELALCSLKAKSKNINLPIFHPSYLNEASSVEPLPMIETVPENYRMLNIHKPLPRHNINVMDKASTSVCENLASNNFVSAQELPIQRLNNSSFVNANESFNSNSNSGRIQFPGNFNVNVAVSPSSSVYSNRQLTRETSFPSTCGIAESANNFLRAAPEPLINQYPLLTSQISGCSPSYVNNASALNDVVEMEGYDIPVDHVMRIPQEPVQSGNIALDECREKNSSPNFIFRCSKCNYITNVKAFFSRHYLEMHVGKKNI